MERLLSGFVLLLSASLALASTPVRVAEIEQEQVDYVVRTYGILAPKVEEISFAIPGRIEDFAVEAGDRVEAEAELARLETLELRALVESRALEVATAERELQRMRTLLERGSVQRAMFDDAQAAYDARAIALEAAREDVVRSVARAPSAGLVLEQFVDSRTNVVPGQPVYLFQSEEEPWITEVGLTDRNVLRMGPGARAEIRFGAHPGRTFEGRLSRLARIADPASGLFVAEITIRPEGAELRPGMVAEVDIRQRSERAFSVIPFDALLEVRGEKGMIFALAPGERTAQRRSITIHSIDRDRVAIEEDLQSFASVVVRGHDRLRDGAEVDVR